MEVQVAVDTGQLLLGLAQPREQVFRISIHAMQGSIPPLDLPDAHVVHVEPPLQVLARESEYGSAAIHSAVPHPIPH